jgi:branched-chain amino acid transport system substrate-binding protein
LRRHSWASFGALAACSSALVACGGGVSAASRVTVYVSMPLRGPSGAAGRDVVAGARMALAQAHGRAGDVRVRAIYLDDTSGPRARWSPARAGANARRATEDTTAVAYVGDFESGASRTSEPITNAARLLQVSPASTAIGLVRPFPGSNELPAGEQEGGERTFGRVIPDDEAQAAAAATWIRRLGAKRVQIVDDNSSYGRTLAEGVRDSLPRRLITGGEPDLVYYGGLAHGERRASSRRALPRGAGRGTGAPVMGSAALLEPFRGRAAPAALYATSSAQDPSQLPPRGRRFAAAFERRYDRAPGPYAAYGYEAMAVVLASIRRAGDEGTDRQAVVDAFFAMRNRRSVLGTYSIDTAGNTTLDRLTGYRLGFGGRPHPVALLPAR